MGGVMRLTLDEAKQMGLRPLKQKPLKPTRLELRLFKALKDLMPQACVNGCPEFTGTAEDGSTTLVVKCTRACKSAHRAYYAAQKAWSQNETHT